MPASPSAIDSWIAKEGIASCILTCEGKGRIAKVRIASCILTCDSLLGQGNNYLAVARLLYPMSYPPEAEPEVGEDIGRILTDLFAL